MLLLLLLTAMMMMARGDVACYLVAGVAEFALQTLVAVCSVGPWSMDHVPFKAMDDDASPVRCCVYLLYILLSMRLQMPPYSLE